VDCRLNKKTGDPGDPGLREAASKAVSRPAVLWSMLTASRNMRPPIASRQATPTAVRRLRQLTARAADPAGRYSAGWVRRLRAAQWGRRGSSDHGRTGAHRCHSDHQRAGRARRRPPSCLPQDRGSGPTHESRSTSSSSSRRACQLLPEQRDSAVLDHRGSGAGDQDHPAVPAVGTSRARWRVRQGRPRETQGEPAATRSKSSPGAVRPVRTIRQNAVVGRMYWSDGRRPLQGIRLRRPLPKRLSALFPSAAVRGARLYRVSAAQILCGGRDRV
jgi:hypothetical protein